MAKWIGKGALVVAVWMLTMMTSAGAITVTDARGVRVTLDNPAERIIALAPHIVENLYSAGAGDKIIGVVSYSDYPPPAQQLPQVGSFMAINREQILAMGPDLVIGWLSGNGAETARQLEELGLTVYMDEPRSLEDVAASIRDLGELAGTQRVSEAVIDTYLADMAALETKYRQARPVTVLYQIWHDPLQTLNDEHLVGDVIRLCGGRNLYADAATLAPKINMESVLARNPEVIVASGSGEERPPWLDEWRQYQELQAVKYNNLFAVNPDWLQRHTLRILLGAEQLCQQLESARQRLPEPDR